PGGPHGPGGTTGTRYGGGAAAGAPGGGATDPYAPVPGTAPSSPYGGPPGYGGYPQGWQAARPGSGLATASLVLGVASPFLVFVCLTGLITAVLSIVFGVVALVRK